MKVRHTNRRSWQLWKCAGLWSLYRHHRRYFSLLWSFQNASGTPLARLLNPGRRLVHHDKQVLPATVTVGRAGENSLLWHRHCR
jgi:hypothetical protein